MKRVAHRTHSRDPRARNLRPVIRGDMVEGMARPKLWEQADGTPVLAVTWPFHDVEALVAVEELVRSLGYDTLFTERSDKKCWELIVGRRQTQQGEVDDEAGGSVQSIGKDTSALN